MMWSMFGVKEASGLGNNADELRVSSEAFQNRYVDPKQDILENLYNSILIFNGLPGCLKTIKTEVVAESFSEATITQVMTTTEIRERLGLSSEEVAEGNFEELSQTCYCNTEKCNSANVINTLLGIVITFTALGLFIR